MRSRTEQGECPSIACFLFSPSLLVRDILISMLTRLLDWLNIQSRRSKRQRWSLDKRRRRSRDGRDRGLRQAYRGSMRYSFLSLSLFLSLSSSVSPSPDVLCLSFSIEVCLDPRTALGVRAARPIGVACADALPNDSSPSLLLSLPTHHHLPSSRTCPPRSSPSRPPTSSKEKRSSSRAHRAASAGPAPSRSLETAQTSSSITLETTCRRARSWRSRARLRAWDGGL